MSFGWTLFVIILNGTHINDVKSCYEPERTIDMPRLLVPAKLSIYYGTRQSMLIVQHNETQDIKRISNHVPIVHLIIKQQQWYTYDHPESNQ